MEKRDLLKLFQEWGERWMKENGGKAEFTLNFCKCHNVRPPSITILKSYFMESKKVK
jgi:hypothetical protein